MASLSHYSPQTAPTLRVGSHGQAVKDVQAKLEQEKLYTASIDGVYGSNTQQAVKTFQRNHHLTPDGIIGHRTWAALVNS
ncbi:peptidoglycan-binding domain-containing protein [Nodosilinea nodulosa]|uniref:peptidoglycan-binding domain-containing protein n=1 Tax=Nodosilinea nodulosa TaxID=416001 RepID=UPI0018C21F31|nr:peptidoglycan-binding domain-containing protein [Nodosilinea nodulosa]